MLSALLGAICAVSMAVAPLLVEPSSNISNNDGDLTSVHGAYYDENGSYGTSSGTFYNYSNTNLWNGNTSTLVSYGGTASVSINSDYYSPYLSLANEAGDGRKEFSTEAEANEIINGNAYAAYINGELTNRSIWVLGRVYGSGGSTTGYYVYLANNINTGIINSSSYTWLFDVEVINYSITANLTHCTANADNPTAYEGSSITLQYTADEGYILPQNISVSNAEYTWDASSGELVISSASDDVSISIVGYEPAAPVDGVDMVGDIAEGLTGGIGTVASGIGGGLQSLVRNIFLVGTYDGEGNFTATGLSTFGIVTIVMASLALALGLSRWVVGWASSLGERNR